MFPFVKQIRLVPGFRSSPSFATVGAAPWVSWTAGNGGDDRRTAAIPRPRKWRTARGAVEETAGPGIGRREGTGADVGEGINFPGFF